MSALLKNIIRYVLFILIQAFILDKIPPLHQLVKPYIYYLYILWLPFSISRVGLLVLAFFFGLTMDYFAGTPGLHAAPCVLIAYLRPFILNVLLPQEKMEVSYIEPGFKSLGFSQYFTYIMILTFVHHAFLIFLEWMSFGNFIYFITKTAISTLISIILVFVAELLFLRKARFRSNAS